MMNREEYLKLRHKCRTAKYNMLKFREKKDKYMDEYWTKVFYYLDTMHNNVTVLDK